MYQPYSYQTDPPEQSKWQRLLQRILQEGKKQLQFLQQNPRYLLCFFVYYLIEVFVSSGGSSRRLPVYAVFCSFYYIISIVIALFWGDKILKLLEGIRPLETKQEIEYLTPLFESVCYDVSRTFENVPRIHIHIVDNLSVNAFALGSHTIAISRGAMETFSTDELKAVIAHEMAHIYYGHAKASLLNTLGKGSFTFSIAFTRWVSRKLDELQPYFIRQKGSLFFWLLVLVYKVLNLINNAFLFLGNLIISGNSRKNEFRADEFAHQVGLGKELTEALYLLQKMSLGDNRRLIQRMIASHPRMSKRIQQLERLEEQQYR